MNILDTLKPGQTIYTILRHQSASGMGRWITLHTVSDTGKILNLTFALKKDPRTEKYFRGRGNTHEGVYVNGCGMDMGFHLVYLLGRVLYPDGVPCIGKGCRSNDHFNDPHGHYTTHSDGGYTFTHQWL